MADEEEIILRRRRYDGELEPRKDFRPRAPGESPVVYAQARMEDKIELALRRTHQIANIAGAVVTQFDLLETRLIGDPIADRGQGGILGHLNSQITEIKSNQEKFISDLPGHIKAGITEASQRRDAQTFRSFKKWVGAGIGALLVAIGTSVAELIAHLPQTPH